MDKHSWINKMLSKYAKAKNPQELDQSKPLKYWDGIMSPEAKSRRNKSFEQIDEMSMDLLNCGYRIVKSSAITPKGDFGLGQSPENTETATAENLFYEQKFNREEFQNLYDYFGRYQNNFPDYFSDEGAFEQYTKTHDIWVVEDIETNRPIAFSTYRFAEDEAESQAYGTKEGEKLLYHDTVALDSDLQGKGIGMKIMDIMDAYYLQTLGENINYALCTGEINTNVDNVLSKGFHEKRGFGQWQEGEAPLKKWIDRYSSLQKQYKRKPLFMPSFMQQSYLGK